VSSLTCLLGLDLGLSNDSSPLLTDELELVEVRVELIAKTLETDPKHALCDPETPIPQLFDPDVLNEPVDFHDNLVGLGVQRVKDRNALSSITGRIALVGPELVAGLGQVRLREELATFFGLDFLLYELKSKVSVLTLLVRSRAQTHEELVSLVAAVLQLVGQVPVHATGLGNTQLRDALTITWKHGHGPRLGEGDTQPTHVCLGGVVLRPDTKSETDSAYHYGKCQTTPPA